MTMPTSGRPATPAADPALQYREYEAQPVDDFRQVRPPIRHRDDAETSRRDRIRWGPVWAGLVVAVATYLLLQLGLVALGVVDLARPTTADAVASAIAAAAAFLLGGITAGGTAMWRGVDDGLLHGIVMWAVGLVVLVVMAAAGSGIALGSIGDVNQAVNKLQAQGADRVQASQDAQDAAGRALAGVAGALAASAIGGVIGAKLWPRRRRDDDIDLRDDLGVREQQSTVTGY